MSLRHYYRPSWRPLATDPAVEFTDFVRLYTFDMASNAEEGSVATSRMVVDDPLGALDFPPLTRIWSVETEVADSSNTYVHHGYIAERVVKRGTSTLTSAARVWELTVVDENSVLTRRVLSSPNANRPAETDVARVLWLANEADGQLLIDTTEFVFAAGPVSMDAVDYRGQTGADVLSDCSQASGKNWYAYFKEGTGTGLWYGSEEHTARESGIRLSNVLSDIAADPNCYAIGQGDDTFLSRDPSRLVSGVWYHYTGGGVYVRNSSLFSQIGLHDQVHASANVKTLAKAQARAQRYLDENDTEDDRITTTVYLPASKVNWVKEGYRIRFRASHLPGYENEVWLRIYTCSKAQISEHITIDGGPAYKVTLEMGTSTIPATPIPNTSPASAILYHPKNFGGGGIMPLIRWEGTGDSPPAGCVAIPLQGSLAYVTDGTAPTAPYRGFQALGDGSLTITFRADDIAAVVNNVTCTASIVVNGAAVATDVHSTTGGGFPYGHSSSWDFSTTVSVVNGDVIEAKFSSTWGSTMTVPSGAGISSLKLLVSGDLT